MPKNQVKPVQKPFLVNDPKCGTVAQQTELYEMLSSFTPEQMQTFLIVFKRLTTGACINGDGTIDPATGLRTTGGYRKSMHYFREYLKNRPVPVNL